MLASTGEAQFLWRLPKNFSIADFRNFIVEWQNNGELHFSMDPVNITWKDANSKAQCIEALHRMLAFGAMQAFGDFGPPPGRVFKMVHGSLFDPTCMDEVKAAGMVACTTEHHDWSEWYITFHGRKFVIVKDVLNAGSKLMAHRAGVTKTNRSLYELLDLLDQNGWVMLPAPGSWQARRAVAPYTLGGDKYL